MRRGVRSLVAVTLLAGCVPLAKPDPEFDVLFSQAVSICELRAHPQTYLDRSVLVRGRCNSNDHGTGLWLEECRSAYTNLRGSGAVTEEPRAARTIDGLMGRNRNGRNEVVYRGTLRAEPIVTGPGSEKYEPRYLFYIEALVAARSRAWVAR